MVATAGHVDHGKSSLVHALSSIDPDRLPEEKKRGITIELGFANFLLTNPTTHQKNIVVGVIDVPGHEDFVKNMVTGVGTVDAAILVVAADDGWMPQTEEHLQILEYLGVQKGLIALTKVDLVSDEDLELAIEFIREEIEGTFLESSPIVPISNKTCEGFKPFKSSLQNLLSESSRGENHQKGRLSIDRIFSKKGIGTIVTGTLIDGGVTKDQEVTIIPGNIKSRVRAIQTYNESNDSSKPGTRTALNLAHVDINSDRKNKENIIHKGSVVLTDPSPHACDRFHVQIERSKRLVSGQYQINRPLKHNSIVRFHSGAGNYQARISLKGKRNLLHSEKCFAQIKLEFPIHLKIGDRFIIRDWSQKATLAGGTVIDPCPGHHKLHHNSQLELLQARIENKMSLQCLILSQVKRDNFTLLDSFNKIVFQSYDELKKTIYELGKNIKVLQRSQTLLDARWWSKHIKHAESLVTKEHEAKPEKVGLRMQSLTASLQRNGFPVEFLPELKEELAVNGFIIKGDFIHHQSHQIFLPEALKPAAHKIMMGLRQNPLDPSNFRAFIVTDTDKKALTFLEDNGEVTAVSSAIFIPTDIFNEYADQVVKFIQTNGPATVSQLKDVIQASRKIMVPFLELLDARGITKRDGDKRTTCK